MKTVDFDLKNLEHELNNGNLDELNDQEGQSMTNPTEFKQVMFYQIHEIARTSRQLRPSESLDIFGHASKRTPDWHHITDKFWKGCPSCELGKGHASPTLPNAISPYEALLARPPTINYFRPTGRECFVRPHQTKQEHQSPTTTKIF